jgi:hypothetical protein
LGALEYESSAETEIFNSNLPDHLKPKEGATVETFEVLKFDYVVKVLMI